MAVLKIYSEIASEINKAFLKFWGEDGISFPDVDAFVDNIPADDNEIEMHLHCPGGECIEGWAIYDKLRSTGKNITAYVDGQCASMATVIMMAAPKDNRHASPNASICVHNPHMAYMGNGTASTFAKIAADLQAEQDKILDLYVERCGCDRDQMQSLMNEDKYIDTDTAMQYGLIADIIQPASANKKNDNSFINHINNKKVMAENNVSVKSSILDKMLAKLGFKSLDAVKFDMDLNTADGNVLTVEREEGEPQVGDKASPDGEHVMPDGSTIVVKDGVITEIRPKADDGNGDNQEGDGNAGDGAGASASDDEKDKTIADLTAKVAKMESEIADLKSKQPSVEDLRILNAVKIAGGAKALAKISSTFTPETRHNDGKNASKANEETIDDAKAAIKKRLAKKQ
jgi:ATP-dependent Clp endopeptidase proteolytic subunit ClpP